MKTYLIQFRSETGQLVSLGAEWRATSPINAILQAARMLQSNGEKHISELIATVQS